MFHATICFGSVVGLTISFLLEINLLYMMERGAHRTAQGILVRGDDENLARVSGSSGAQNTIKRVNTYDTDTQHTRQQVFLVRRSLP